MGGAACRPGCCCRRSSAISTSSGMATLMRPWVENCPRSKMMNSKGMTIAGWILSGLFVLFMLGASVTPKLAGMQVADDTMRQLGWPDGFVLIIGIVELVC